MSHLTPKGVMTQGLTTTGLNSDILVQSYVDKDSCYEFICATVMPCLEDNILHHLLALTLFCSIFFDVSWSMWSSEVMYILGLQDHKFPST